MANAFPNLENDASMIHKAVGINEKYSFFLGGGIFFFRAASATYGDSQARGRTGAGAASLRHSHSNARSELCLRPTPQLMAMPDP